MDNGTCYCSFYSESRHYNFIKALLYFGIGRSFSCPYLTCNRNKKTQWLGSSNPLDAWLLRESMPKFKSRLAQDKTMSFSICTRPCSSLIPSFLGVSQK